MDVAAENNEFLIRIFTHISKYSDVPNNRAGWNNWLREKFYPEKSSTPRKVLPREKVYPGKNTQFGSNQADIGET